MKAYESAIFPYQGEKHYPPKDMPFNPLEVNWSSRPWKKIRKDPHEDLKKQAYKEDCSTGHKVSHNSRTYPQKGKLSNAPPPKKRKRKDQGKNPLLHHEAKEEGE